MPVTKTSNKVDWNKKLEQVGAVLTGAFGDRVAIGMLFGYLENVTPEICYGHIKNCRPLLEKVSEEDWGRWRDMAKKARIEVTLERIVAEFQKRRPDLLSIVINTPDGMTWLRSQVAILQTKLN